MAIDEKAILASRTIKKTAPPPPRITISNNALAGRMADAKHPPITIGVDERGLGDGVGGFGFDMVD